MEGGQKIMNKIRGKKKNDTDDSAPAATPAE